MLTTLVLIVGLGCLFLLAVAFSALVVDAVRNGVPVSRLGVWMTATRHGYIDVADQAESPTASVPSEARADVRPGERTAA